MAALDDQPDPIDPAGSPYDTVLGGETSARVAAALETLPERQRAAIVLCFWEGESNIAAAETLGITVGALESLLVRAKRALRDALDDTLGPAAAGGPDEEEAMNPERFADLNDASGTNPPAWPPNAQPAAAQ